MRTRLTTILTILLTAACAMDWDLDELDELDTTEGANRILREARQVEARYRVFMRNGMQHIPENWPQNYQLSVPDEDHDLRDKMDYAATNIAEALRKRTNETPYISWLQNQTTSLRALLEKVRSYGERQPTYCVAKRPFKAAAKESVHAGSCVSRRETFTQRGQANQQAPREVKLAVSRNTLGRNPRFGVYHMSVLVGDTELEFDLDNGINQNDGHAINWDAVIIPVGQTTKSIEDIVATFQGIFRRGAYNIITLNCNVFADVVLRYTTSRKLRDILSARPGQEAQERWQHINTNPVVYPEDDAQARATQILNGLQNRRN